MRRSLTVLMSLGLMLGLGAIRSLVAQDEEPASPAPKAGASQEKVEEPKEAPAAAPAAAPSVPASPDELPAEVKQKREAALKAVAELIVAAEEAGLVQTNLDPPPVLEILVTGRATDKSALEASRDNTQAQVGLVSPESFAAYFTGYAETPEGLTAQANVRIAQPSEGLKAFYDQRAEALRPFLDAARGSQADAPAEPSPAEPKAEMKKDEPKAEEPKAEEPKAEEPKAEEPKKEEMKKEEPKEEPKAEEPKTEAPKDEPKTEAPKDEPKAEEPKAEEPKAEPKAEEPKDEPKAEEPKDEPSSDEPK